jgi:glycosyltransferase involved in cell wall biosynthesis
MKVSLIILTRNEIAGMTAVFKKIPLKNINDYFVVDLNSTDGTLEFCRKNKIKVVHQTIPGRSEAFRLGARHAKGEYLIFFSPDGNEDPKDIDKMIAIAKEETPDMVVGSRFLPAAVNEEDDQTFKWRKWANQGFTMLTNIFFGGHLSDTINGYRMIKKSAFEELNPDAKGFAIEYQMSMRALKKKMKIVEFPTIEGQRIGGASGSKAIPTGLQFLKYFAREVYLGNKF